MALQTPAGSPESATIERTIRATVPVPQCMQDTGDASTPRSPGSFCGVHGTCAGPSGCKCDPRWYGIRCNGQSEELVAPEFVWRGWTVLFIVVVLGARRTEAFLSRWHDQLGDDGCFVCEICATQRLDAVVLYGLVSFGWACSRVLLGP